MILILQLVFVLSSVFAATIPAAEDDKCINVEESCLNIYECTMKMYYFFKLYHLNSDIEKIITILSNKPKCNEEDFSVCCPFGRYNAPDDEEPPEIMENLKMPTTPLIKANSTMPTTPKIIKNSTMPTTPKIIKNSTMPTTPKIMINSTMPTTTKIIANSTMPTTPKTMINSTMPVTTPSVLSNSTMKLITPITTIATIVNSTTNAPVTENNNGTEDITQHPNFHVLAGPQCGFGLFPRVSSGEVVNPGELPWLVMLRYRDENGSLVFRCGGALISDRYVLTAAHCIFEPDLTIKLLSVFLGETTLNIREDCVFDDRLTNPWCGEPQEIKIEDTIPHPDFNYRNALLGYPNDIGLIRLRRVAMLTLQVMPICVHGLANREVEEFMNIDKNNNLLVAGWGMVNMSQNPTSNELRRVRVSIIEKPRCDALHRRETNQCQLCAGGEQGNACRGDSGGPLMTKAVDPDNKRRCPLLLGIVSFGSETCGHKIPTVFSNVKCYLKWILDNVKD